MRLGVAAEPALRELLKALEAAGYAFVTVTPASHERVARRPAKAVARDLRDVFGWSLPFPRTLLPDALLAPLERAEAVETRADGLLHANIRVSRLDDRLFVHSAYPTEAEDAVFFGPDSYRFVDFLRAELPQVGEVRRLVDLGAGAGVGAIMAGALLPGARLTLVDVNPAALRIAGINADHAGLNVELIEGSGIDAVEGAFDLVIANPPFIVDDKARAYRDGGELFGGQVALDWARASAARLASGGAILLYTGAAIVNGRNLLCDALAEALPRHGCTLHCRELDPDIFGEELDNPAYETVERIAAVGIVIERS